MRKSIVLVVITFIIAFFAINTSFSQESENYISEYSRKFHPEWVVIQFDNDLENTWYDEGKFVIREIKEDVLRIYSIKICTKDAAELESMCTANAKVLLHFPGKKTDKKDWAGRFEFVCDVIVINGKTYHSK
jgi:hypothetical protein